MRGSELGSLSGVGRTAFDPKRKFKRLKTMTASQRFRSFTSVGPTSGVYRISIAGYARSDCVQANARIDLLPLISAGMCIAIWTVDLASRNK